MGLRFTCFISFCICSNWRSSLFTSSTRVPEPAAMRRLRLGLMIEGFSRSAGVMLWIMASMCAISFEFSSASTSTLPEMPGIMESMAPTPPIFFNCWNWASMSFMSNLFSSMRLAVFSASLASAVLCAFSISVSTSPMPRMRLAMRSG